MIEEMTKEELVSFWEKTQSGSFPANRSKNSPLDSFYPITNYFVKVEDNKPIAGIGYSNKGEFTLYGGVFSTKRGEYSKLDDYFMSNTTGPYIAGVSSSTIPNEQWASVFRKRGWDIEPENLGKYNNNPIILDFKRYYSNHPKGAKWAVKGLPLQKSWFNILKIDETYYNPDDRGAGGYNPRTGKVELNLAQIGKDGKEETYISDIIRVASHEYAHKELARLLQPVYDELESEIAKRMFSIIRKGDNKSILDSPLTALAEIISLDEAFAYISESRAADGLFVGVENSASDYLAGTFVNISRLIFAQTTSQEDYNNVRQKMVELANYAKNHTMRIVREIHQKTVDFLLRDKNLTPQKVAGLAEKKIQGGNF